MKLRLKANKISYSNLFNNVNIETEEGKITVISGKPQSGKSTLLSILAGLITPTSGSVNINGRSVSECPYNIGYIYDPAHIKCIDDIFSAPAISGYNHNFVIINHRLETYGYISFTTPANKPSFLSNDILNIADIILIDEMFPHMSHYYSHDYYEALYKLTKNEKKLCIVAVSDNNHIYNYSDKIIYLNK